MTLQPSTLGRQKPVTETTAPQITYQWCTYTTDESAEDRKNGSSAWRTKGVLAVWDGERRIRISETQARDKFNEVDAAKNASTLCRIIYQDAEWRMVRDNAHPSILQPMRQSVELLKTVSAFRRPTTAPSP
jgi:hypothetical protein